MRKWDIWQKYTICCFWYHSLVLNFAHFLIFLSYLCGKALRHSGHRYSDTREIQNSKTGATKYSVYTVRLRLRNKCLCTYLPEYMVITLSVTQSAFASTSDRPLCFPRACVGLIGPRPSDYPHALSACYYFLPAVFLLALGLWSSLPARQLSLDTSYSFLTFSVFFFFFFFF